jgi:RNA polymerase sigma-70 factor (ECF subfamily)
MTARSDLGRQGNSERPPNVLLEAPMQPITRPPTPFTPAADRQRDRDFAALALPLLPNIKRFAVSLARNEADADDIVQETFLRAHRYWSTFDTATDCRRWLMTVCRNAFYDMSRREAKSIAVEDDELESLETARTHNVARAAGLGDMYSRLDLGPAIQSAIAQLDPVFRDVVVLSDVEGFSYEDIAGMLTIPLGTVRSRLFRARRQLQEMLMVFAMDAGFGRPQSGGPIPRVEKTS